MARGYWIWRAKCYTCRPHRLSSWRRRLLRSRSNSWPGTRQPAVPLREAFHEDLDSWSLPSRAHALKWRAFVSTRKTAMSATRPSPARLTTPGSCDCKNVTVCEILIHNVAEMMGCV